jgi:hypothetical protein
MFPDIHVYMSPYFHISMFSTFPCLSMFHVHVSRSLISKDSNTRCEYLLGSKDTVYSYVITH